VNEYKYAVMPDPYCYENSSVLKNKLGQKDFDLLQTAEMQITRARLLELQVNPVTGRFGFTHLKKVHRYIFQDIYDWAGETRQGGFLTKGGTIFCRGDYIDQYADSIFNKLKSDNYLKDLNKHEFIRQLAYYMSEVNALHPFREGNGRSNREFFRELALKAGYKLQWELVQPDILLAADINAFNKEYKNLINVLHGVCNAIN